MPYHNEAIDRKITEYAYFVFEVVKILKFGIFVHLKFFVIGCSVTKLQWICCSILISVLFFTFSKFSALVHARHCHRTVYQIHLTTLPQKKILTCLIVTV